MNRIEKGDSLIQTRPSIAEISNCNLIKYRTKDSEKFDLNHSFPSWNA